ncbi:metalloendopeptidase [Martiniozyma asiatica (nom. inval.)]|nr:metalloendopeptidase [Martiniozyma asiatica]
MSTFKLPQPAPLWNHTPNEISVFTTELINEAKSLDDTVASICSADAKFSNVIAPLANLENKQQGLINQITFYQHVSADKKLRDASNEADAKLRAYNIEAGLRVDVFKAIDAVYQKYQSSKENSELDSESLKFLEKIHNQYKRNGLALEESQRKKVGELKDKLSKLSLKYSQNLSEETEGVLFLKEELKGVPSDVIENFEEINGKLKMTFKYPDVLPVMKYAQIEETRKKALKGDQNKCPENANILIEAVKLRAELANLLGYENYSQYVLEERMAKKPETVLNFLNDLKTKLMPLSKKELEKLKKMKSVETGNEESEYFIWDQRYFNNKMLENEYNVDDLKISEFFPMQNTIDKMLAIYEKIFKLKFIETKKEDTVAWHEDVKHFEVWKMDIIDSPEFVGHLYFDLHPRTGKYGHAANFGLIPGFIDMSTGKRNYPVTSLVCNFTKDTPSKPSLLKHNEVVTFFHELGHGIHDLMGNTKYSRFHGTSVSWDFVECPSQLLEYFCWEPAQLKFLSSHYETGEPLDDSLIESLVKSKNVNGAMFNLRQLHFGLFDMSLHTSTVDEIKNNKLNVYSLWNDMREEICGLSNGGEQFRGFGSFGHMMGGYASGYYGYLWSQVYAADVFYTNFKPDCMNVSKGVKYRDIILSRGGSKDEADNLKELLGREVEMTSFLKELGLA